MNVLIAGMGNTLRKDDSFGVEVIRRLQTAQLPENVDLMEVGIAGISLVQELMAKPYDALLIVDAMQRDQAAGTVYLLEATVPETSNYTNEQLQTLVTEPHTTGPDHVLILARALHVLPSRVYLIGCEPKEYDELDAEMSEPVKEAVEDAAEQIKALLTKLLN